MFGVLWPDGPGKHVYPCAVCAPSPPQPSRGPWAHQWSLLSAITQRALSVAPPRLHPKKGVHRTGMQSANREMLPVLLGSPCSDVAQHTLTNSSLLPSSLRKKNIPLCSALGKGSHLRYHQNPCKDHSRTPVARQWISGSQRERRVEREWAMVLILFSVTFAHLLNPIGHHVVASPQSTDPLYRCSTQSRRFRTLYVHTSACSREAASGTVRQTQPGGKPPVEQKSRINERCTRLHDRHFQRNAKFFWILESQKQTRRPWNRTRSLGNCALSTQDTNTCGLEQTYAAVPKV